MVESVQKNKKFDDMKSLIDSSHTAIDGIKSNEISEVKSFKNPPTKVKEVLEVCYILMNNSKPKDWQDIKQNMLTANFQQNLKSLDLYKIPTDTIQMMKNEIEKYELTMNKVRQVSSASAKLFEFMQVLLDNEELLAQPKEENDKN